MERPARSPIGWAIAASLALHLVAALLIGVLPPAVRREAPPERGLVVDLVAERRAPSAPVVQTPAPGAGRGEPEIADPEAPEPKSSGPKTSEPEVAAPATADVGPDGMIRAARLMSADVLADPRSRAGRAALAGFGDADRLVQLCGIEAMEQVDAWDTRLQPDSVVAYAMADAQIGEHAVVADGGAIRAGETWYDLAFRCDLAADDSHVVAFRFRLGAPIPREEWEEHKLPEGAEPLE